MPKPTKHYNQWRVRWKEGGKYRSRNFQSHKDAKEFAAKIELERAAIKRGDLAPVRRDVTFHMLVDHWVTVRAPTKRSGKDDESIIRRHLEPYFGSLRLDQINTAAIQRFSAAKRHLAPKTLHNLLTLLKAMLNEAVDQEWLVKAPKVRKPKISVGGQDFNYLRSPDEVKRFLTAAREVRWDLYALYATAIYTGMRAGELAGLRWSDVDFERRLICVQRSYTGPTKNGEARHVPILDPLLPILKRQKMLTGRAHAFPNDAGRMHQPSARVFQEQLHAVLEAAGFEPVEHQGKTRPYITFHGLRHTFASHWMMSGGDLYTLQKIGGWKSTQMVQRYAHLSPDAFTKHHGRLDALRLPKSGSVIEFAPKDSKSRGRSNIELVNEGGNFTNDTEKENHENHG